VRTQGPLIAIVDDDESIRDTTKDLLELLSTDRVARLCDREPPLTAMHVRPDSHLRGPGKRPRSLGARGSALLCIHQRLETSVFLNWRQAHSPD
jgi:hypothetical protein